MSRYIAILSLTALVGATGCWHVWQDDDCYEELAYCDFWGCYYELVCPGDNYYDPHHKKHKRPERHRDGGLNTPDATVDAGVSGPDSSAADGGVGDAQSDAPPPPNCDGTGSCSEGFQCVQGVCQACPGGVCPCTSDDACELNEQCNLGTGQCDPILCSDLTTLESCLDRGDCFPVYSGQNCTKPGGGTCEPGDTGCTCESFEFAVCAEL